MSQPSVAIIGTGPAALTAATYLTKAGIKPVLFDSRPAPGWKLLVAGSSGLNVTYDCPEEDLPGFYTERGEEMAAILKRFTRDAWLKLLANLGEEPYVGSSKRYFLRNKTAATLLKSWTASLEEAGAQFVYGEELVKIEQSPLTLHFASGKVLTPESALLALGGGSWEPEAPKWPEMLRALELEVSDLLPSNAGYRMKVPPEFFEKAEGQPIKGLVLTTTKGERQGELMITKYGLEGTPIYSVGTPGKATLDLKPDLSVDKLAERIANGRGSISQRVEHTAKLSTGAWLMLKQFAPDHAWSSPARIAAAIKDLTIQLLQPRPLSESISARGGLSWDELGENLDVKRIPGLYAAGEMVDWDAPTGGFLIQGSASMGFVAACGIAAQLKAR
jgi:uncharacterized flavoprotein (TIGR03862 family)